jgi:microcystin-dependent protein
MCQLFVFNHSETQKHNNKQNYYSVNERKGTYLTDHAPLDARIKTLLTRYTTQSRDDLSQRNNLDYKPAVHNAVSEADIKRAATQVSIDGVWEGHKFLPKSFKVFKLSDVVDRLQVAIISKQLMAEKANGAVIRRIGSLNSLLNVATIFASLDNASLFAALSNSSVLAALINTSSLSSVEGDNVHASDNAQGAFIGEIKLYAGSSSPHSAWLPCDGSIVSRSTYPQLFSIIGTKYGHSDDLMTFKLPDLRGRVPLGIDIQRLRVDKVIDVGMEGGHAEHELTIEQLPSHVHDRGSLRNIYDGHHIHNVYDPGHNHMSERSSYAVSSSLPNDYGKYNQQATGFRQWFGMTAAAARTQISLHTSGNHTHNMTGHTSAVGNNKSFSLLPPFQAFHYMIYAG